MSPQVINVTLNFDDLNSAYYQKWKVRIFLLFELLGIRSILEQSKDLSASKANDFARDLLLKSLDNKHRQEVMDLPFAYHIYQHIRSKYGAISNVRTQMASLKKKVTTFSHDSNMNVEAIAPELNRLEYLIGSLEQTRIQSEMLKTMIYRALPGRFREKLDELNWSDKDPLRMVSNAINCYSNELERMITSVNITPVKASPVQVHAGPIQQSPTSPEPPQQPAKPPAVETVEMSSTSNASSNGSPESPKVSSSGLRPEPVVEKPRTNGSSIAANHRTSVIVAPKASPEDDSSFEPQIVKVLPAKRSSSKSREATDKPDSNREQVHNGTRRSSERSGRSSERSGRSSQRSESAKDKARGSPVRSHRSLDRRSRSPERRGQSSERRERHYSASLTVPPVASSAKRSSSDKDFGTSSPKRAKRSSSLERPRPRSFRATSPRPSRKFETYVSSDGYSKVFVLDRCGQYHVVSDRRLLIKYETFKTQKEILVTEGRKFVKAIGKGTIRTRKGDLEDVHLVPDIEYSYFSAKAAHRDGFENKGYIVFSHPDGRGDIKGRQSAYGATFMIYAQAPHRDA